MKHLLSRQAYARSEGGRTHTLCVWRNRQLKTDTPFYLAVGAHRRPYGVGDFNTTSGTPELEKIFRDCPKGCLPFIGEDGVEYRKASERVRNSRFHSNLYKYRLVIWGEE
jgi:hypothetical protein